MQYCTFKGDKGKRLDVQSQIYKFFPGMPLFVNSLQKLNFCISLFTCFFYKHNAYKHILPGISEKNKHMLSILFSLENSCSFLFSWIKSHSEVYSEPCQTSKIKLLPKIVNGFSPLNIFTKSFILDVCQGSDYASIIFSKAAGLQPSAYNFTKRWALSQVFFKDFGNLSGAPLDGCFKTDRCYKKCC